MGDNSQENLAEACTDRCYQILRKLAEEKRLKYGQMAVDTVFDLSLLWGQMYDAIMEEIQRAKVEQ